MTCWQKAVSFLLLFFFFLLVRRLQQAAKRICLRVIPSISVYKVVYSLVKSFCWYFWCWTRTVYTYICSWQSKTGRIWREILFFSISADDAPSPSLARYAWKLMVSDFGKTCWKHHHCDVLKPLSMAPLSHMFHDEISKGLFSFPAALPSIIST